VIKSSQKFTAFIALGSNLGDRNANITQAIALLSALQGCRIEKISSVYETEAVNMPIGTPPFLNAVVCMVGVGLDAQGLLEYLQLIEQRDFNRSDKGGNLSRGMDLDLLLYNDDIIQTEHLIVPHPRLHERYFVLAPLAEIAPSQVIPTLGCTVTTLLTAVTKGSS
jgi:2-amino-4-hydroxy-6-hydroxymethyldihydropteridine diphosphokinase